MRRSLTIRRLSAAVLLFVSVLLLVALAPLLVDVRPSDNASSMLGVHALQADTLVVENPLVLSVSPNITLVSGIVSQTGSVSGAGRTVVLSGAVIDVDFTGQGAASAPFGMEFLSLSTSPLIDIVAALDIDRLSLRKATLRVRWNHDKAVTLRNMEANVGVRGKQVASVVGTFDYLVDSYSFDAQTGPPSERAADADMRAGTRRTLQLKLTSPCLAVTFDGHAELADTIVLRGITEARTDDAGKLAAALGYRWSEDPNGPALLVKGPVRWAQGAIMFGRSEISLGDQTGQGAISISAREGRPRLEATLAFPALDVGSLLQRGGPAATLRPPWLAISTSFPAIAQLDAELRLSAARLQWNGSPIGKGAATISATGGKLHGDIAELDLGRTAGTGSLQFAIDHTVVDAPVLLRGRFEISDAGTLTEHLFGTETLRGRATTQFEIMGQGTVLGDVLKSASGRGTLVMRDGQMLLDLTDLQRQIAAVSNGERPAGWGAVAKISALDALEAKFQLRDGVLKLEQFNAVSRGLVASAAGRIGLTTSDLDLAVRVMPAGAARLGPSRSLAASARPAGNRDGASIRGPWTAPVIAAADVDLTP